MPDRSLRIADRGEIIRWVATQVLPHEAALRRWLSQSVSEPADVNDIIHEAYCRLSELDQVAHIHAPRAYLFKTVRSILLERLRRAQIVKISAIGELNADQIADDQPSPEEIMGSRLELDRVLALIETLPPAYRDVLRLRRLHGLSQKEAAQMLGLSEKVVENNMARGLRKLLSALTAIQENEFGGARIPEQQSDSCQAMTTA